MGAYIGGEEGDEDARDGGGESVETASEDKESHVGRRGVVQTGEKGERGEEDRGFDDAFDQGEKMKEGDLGEDSDMMVALVITVVLHCGCGEMKVCSANLAR